MRLYHCTLVVQVVNETKHVLVLVNRSTDQPTVSGCILVRSSAICENSAQVDDYSQETTNKTTTTLIHTPQTANCLHRQRQSASRCAALQSTYNTRETATWTTTFLYKIQQSQDLPQDRRHFWEETYAVSEGNMHEPALLTQKKQQHDNTTILITPNRPIKSPAPHRKFPCGTISEFAFCHCRRVISRRNEVCASTVKVITAIFTV